MFKRGEIYYIERSEYAQNVGSEQSSGRPAIIVSNDKNNEFSPTLEVVYLTTQPKTDLPTHIDIRSTKKASIALCEQITSVSVQRVGDYVGECSEYEMQMIDAALAISLNLDFGDPKVKAKPQEVKTEVKPEPSVVKFDETVIKLMTERDLYKTLYEQMLERMVSR